MADAATAGPTPAQRAAAEKLRAEGNRLFGRGKYAAAADLYTEAITLAASAPLYVNRALCARRLAGDGAAGGGAGAEAAWRRVEEDSARALELDRRSIKANYLRGRALRELDAGGGLHAAIAHLERALDEARAQDDAIKDEIWRELAKAQDAGWQASAAARRKEAALLRDQLRALAAAAGAPPPPDALAGAAAGPEAERGRGCGVGAWGQPASACGAGCSAPPASSAQHVTPGGAQGGIGHAGSGGSGSRLGGPALDWAALDRLLARAAAPDTPAPEVPQAFCCPLTYSIFRDPVLVTKSGHTYERSVITEHLSKVGGWDPITRAPCTVSDLSPNIALRGAIQVYLQEHSWAWSECY